MELICVSIFESMNYLTGDYGDVRGVQDILPSGGQGEGSAFSEM